MKCANKNGWNVIRLLHEDVLNDVYDWVLKIKECVNKILKERKSNPTLNVFICRTDEYDTYIDMMNNEE